MNDTPKMSPKRTIATPGSHLPPPTLRNGGGSIESPLKNLDENASPNARKLQEAQRQNSGEGKASQARNKNKTSRKSLLPKPGTKEAQPQVPMSADSKAVCLKESGKDSRRRSFIPTYKGTPESSTKRDQTAASSQLRDITSAKDSTRQLYTPSPLQHSQQPQQLSGLRQPGSHNLARKSQLFNQSNFSSDGLQTPAASTRRTRESSTLSKASKFATPHRKNPAVDTNSTTTPMGSQATSPNGGASGLTPAQKHAYSSRLDELTRPGSSRLGQLTRWKLEKELDKLSPQLGQNLGVVNTVDRCSRMGMSIRQGLPQARMQYDEEQKRERLHNIANSIINDVIDRAVTLSFRTRLAERKRVAADQADELIEAYLDEAVEEAVHQAYERLIAEEKAELAHAEAKINEERQRKFSEEIGVQMDSSELEEQPEVDNDDSCEGEEEEEAKEARDLTPGPSTPVSKRPVSSTSLGSPASVSGQAGTPWQENSMAMETPARLPRELVEVPETPHLVSQVFAEKSGDRTENSSPMSTAALAGTPHHKQALAMTPMQPAREFLETQEIPETPQLVSDVFAQKTSDGDDTVNKTLDFGSPSSVAATKGTPAPKQMSSALPQSPDTYSPALQSRDGTDSPGSTLSTSTNVEGRSPGVSSTTVATPYSDHGFVESELDNAIKFAESFLKMPFTARRTGLVSAGAFSTPAGFTAGPIPSTTGGLNANLRTRRNDDVFTGSPKSSIRFLSAYADGTPGVPSTNSTSNKDAVSPPLPPLPVNLAVQSKEAVCTSAFEEALNNIEHDDAQTTRTAEAAAEAATLKQTSSERRSALWIVAFCLFSLSVVISYSVPVQRQYEHARRLSVFMGICTDSLESMEMEEGSVSTLPISCDALFPQSAESQLNDDFGHSQFDDSLEQKAMPKQRSGKAKSTSQDRKPESAERKAKKKARREAKLKAEREASELEAKLKAEREGVELEAKLKAEREAAELEAKMKAEREAAEFEAKMKAEREAAELEAKMKAEREAAEREAAEREAKMKAEREAAELEAKMKAEREAAELEAKMKAEREAAELEAKMKAEREAAELEAKMKAEREAAEFEAKMKAEREAAELEAKMKAEREAAEREAVEREAKMKAEREAAELEAKMKAEREAAELEAKMKAEREAAELEAKMKAEREAAEFEAKMKAEREAAELEAKMKAEREAAELEAKMKAEREAAELEAKMKAEREAAELEAKVKAEREASELDVSSMEPQYTEYVDDESELLIDMLDSAGQFAAWVFYVSFVKFQLHIVFAVGSAVALVGKGHFGPIFGPLGNLVSQLKWQLKHGGAVTNSDEIIVTDYDDDYVDTYVDEYDNEEVYGSAVTSAGSAVGGQRFVNGYGVDNEDDAMSADSEQDQEEYVDQQELAEERRYGGDATSPRSNSSYGKGGLYRAVEFVPVRGTPMVQMRHVRRSRRNADKQTLPDTPMQFPAGYLKRSGSFTSHR